MLTRLTSVISFGKNCLFLITMISSLKRQSDFSAALIPGYGDLEVTEKVGYGVTNDITMP